MGRVRANVVVAERNCWTLFDTGARNTYIVQDIATLLPMQEWGIKPVPDEERLDMTYYPKEFIEF